MFTRALIVLLLVLNLGVAAWWMFRSPPVPAAAPSEPAGIARLQLLSEAAPASPTPAASPQTAAPAVAPDAVAGAAVGPPETSAPAPQCFTAGPFADDAAARRALAALQASGLQGNARSEAGARGGTWAVAMPPQADRAAAQALAQRIAAAGFSDYYIVSQGEQANAIALGRFGNEATAQRHRDALQAAGFTAVLQPPAGAQMRWWLDLRAPPRFDPGSVRAVPGATLQSAACGTLR